MGNWLENFDECSFQGMNDPKVEKLGNGEILFKGVPGVDFFNDPRDEPGYDNAPFLYTEVEGDFVCTMCGEHDCLDMYDAFSLVAWHDFNLFTSICFERIEFGLKSIVSVVTRGVSDDSRGQAFDGNLAWIRMTREGNVFTNEYSENGEDWFMTRLYRLDMPDVIKVGMAVQSSHGKGTRATIKYFEIEVKS